MPDTQLSGDDIALSDQRVSVNTLKKFMGTPTIPKRWKTLSDAVAGVMYGLELGLAPMESLQRLYMINGALAADGKALAALIHRAGHILIMDEMSNTRGAVKAMRRDPYNHALIEVGVFEFTWDDAVQAGLAQQDTYEEYPKDMLYWRAVSRAAKLAFPDVTTGMLMPEELMDNADVVHITEMDIAEATVVDVLSAKEEAIDQGYGHEDSYGD
jgi:hypothetical protein